MAMQRGLLESDLEWLNEDYMSRSGAAHELDEAGTPALAWIAYSSLSTDFSGLLPGSEASDRAAVLAADPEVKAWLARRTGLARDHMEYKGESLSGGLRRLSAPQPWLDSVERTPSIEVTKNP